MITSDDILGKDVLDPTGKVVGVALKLHLDLETNSIIGVTVDRGFGKGDLYIGINHIKNFGVDTVFLNITPNLTCIGKPVYTQSGSYKGKVVAVGEPGDDNSLIALHNGKKRRIAAEKIRSIGDSVIVH